MREKNPQHIIDLMLGDDSVDAPTDSIRWASNLFRSRAAEPKRTLVQKLAAILQMEIAPNKPAFGERSASTSQARQLLYRAGSHAIDIRIESKKKAFDLRGQILGDGFAGASLKLFNDSRAFDTQANENSEFAFENVPSDRYDLVINADGVEITLKAIDI